MPDQRNLFANAKAQLTDACERQRVGAFAALSQISNFYRTGTWEHGVLPPHVEEHEADAWLGPYAYEHGVLIEIVKSSMIEAGVSDDKPFPTVAFHMAVLQRANDLVKPGQPIDRFAKLEALFEQAAGKIPQPHPHAVRILTQALGSVMRVLRQPPTSPLLQSLPIREGTGHCAVGSGWPGQ